MRGTVEARRPPDAPATATKIEPKMKVIGSVGSSTRPIGVVKMPGTEIRRRRALPESGRSRIAATMLSTLARNEETVIVRKVMITPIPPDVISDCQVTFQRKVKPNASSPVLMIWIIPTVTASPSSTPITAAPRL